MGLLDQQRNRELAVDSSLSTKQHDRPGDRLIKAYLEILKQYDAIDNSQVSPWAALLEQEVKRCNPTPRAILDFSQRVIDHVWLESTYDLPFYGIENVVTNFSIREAYQNGHNCFEIDASSWKPERNCRVTHFLSGSAEKPLDITLYGNTTLLGNLHHCTIALRDNTASECSSVRDSHISFYQSAHCKVDRGRRSHFYFYDTDVSISAVATDQCTFYFPTQELVDHHIEKLSVTTNDMGDVFTNRVELFEVEK